MSGVGKRIAVHQHADAVVDADPDHGRGHEHVDRAARERVRHRLLVGARKPAVHEPHRERRELSGEPGVRVDCRAWREALSCVDLAILERAADIMRATGKLATGLRRAAIIAGVVLLSAGCAQFSQMGRRECLNYQNRDVTESYCQRMAPQTCSYTSGGQRTCFGGGYCVSTGTRTRTVSTCVDSRCKPEYAEIDGKCLTAQEQKERQKDLPARR